MGAFIQRHSISGQRIRYFFSCLAKVFSGKWHACPNCLSQNSSIVDSKYLVTKLMRCGDCNLLYRVPTTSEKGGAGCCTKAIDAGRRAQPIPRNTIPSEAVMPRALPKGPPP